MSKHRAADRSVLRFAPFGAGVTAALMAAGTGSAFAAAPAELPALTTTSACEDATTTLRAAQGAVDSADRQRDDARRELRRARADLEKAQAPLNTALRQRDAAQERLDSRMEREGRRNAAVLTAGERVKNRETVLAERKAAVTTLETRIRNEPSRVNRWRLQRDLDVARERVDEAERALRVAKRDQTQLASELASAQRETVEADARLTEKQKVLDAAKPAGQDKVDAVTAAAEKLKAAEVALAEARGERRTARDARTQACTSDVSTRR